MCGIAGIIVLDGESLERSLIVSMVDSVSHRGPDGEGILIEKNVAIGHRRLAILDLSPDGIQPMSSANGMLSIVFNGEVYNYVELRSYLRSKGHNFRTQTDTEVILAAYREWGQDCVRHFNGMWAFAIYDKENKKIFCSRDRFGKKPFYYINNGKYFAFGSEIRQLKRFTDTSVNMDTLIKFLVFGKAEPTTETFFAEIFKLQGGHNLEFDLRTSSIRIDRYYTISFHPEVAQLSIEEAKRQFLDTFSDAIRLRLRSDVPVGTCLSGGLDSSIIAGFACQQSNAADGQFVAVTAISEQASNDESAFASKVVSKFGMRWLTTKPNYEDFAIALPEIMDAQEEPFPSASIAMQFFVMKCVKANNIPVLLDGQGGDETFLGYEKYFAAYYRMCIRRKGVVGALRAIHKHKSMMSWWDIAGTYCLFNFPFVRWLRDRRRHFYFKNRPPTFDAIRRSSKANKDFSHLQVAEIESVSLPALLRYEDKNSMWHSIETRLPFLDYRLVEFALSLPVEYKITDGWTKYILRFAVDGLLPEKITWRRDKLGFEAPEVEWLSKHANIMRVTILKSQLLEHICDLTKVNQYWNKINTSTRWRLFCVALWETQSSVKL
jgi:asparagine synthase (glutamine-hydrolysing)